jgi:hypothetical protein
MKRCRCVGAWSRCFGVVVEVVRDMCIAVNRDYAAFESVKCVGLVLGYCGPVCLGLCVAVGFPLVWLCTLLIVFVDAGSLVTVRACLCSVIFETCDTVTGTLLFLTQD